MPGERPPLLLVVAVALITACRDPIATFSGPTPAISLTLVAGETLQVATVTIATPADSLLPREGVPAAPADVQLRLEDDSGGVWSARPLATPGRFGFAVSPEPGRRYRLLGSVRARPVSAATTVPTRLDLVSLPADTITPADSVPCAGARFDDELCFPFVTATDQPLAISCTVAPRDPSRLEPCFYTDPTHRELRLARSAATRELLVIGRNSDATHSKVAATVTRFGGALLVRRAVALP